MNIFFERYTLRLMNDSVNNTSSWYSKELPMRTISAWNELPTSLFNSTVVTSTQEQITVGYSVAESALLGLFLSLIILFSIAGNVLVIVAILTDRNLRKSSNYFYISLAVADTLVAVVVMSFAVVNDILGRWMFGEALCDLWMSSDIMCSTASILNLCAISLDRFMHIRDPYQYERVVTTGKILGTIGLVWLLSALISFLPIHLNWHWPESSAFNTPVRAEVAGNRTSCALQLNPVYAVCSSLISFYLPCLVMLIIYLRLFQYARRHVKTIKRSWATTSGNNFHTQHHSTSASSVAAESRIAVISNPSSYEPSDHKAAITLGIIMGVFLLCWAPFFTINIVGAFCPACIPSVAFSTFTWLGYINSAMNPVIYPIFNMDFRQSFKRVLSSVFRRSCNGHSTSPVAPDRCHCCSACCPVVGGCCCFPKRAHSTATSDCEYGIIPSRKCSSSRLVTERITTL